MSILKVNTIQDKGGNAIISSDGSGNLTQSFAASEYFSTTGFQAYKNGGDQSLSNNTWTVVSFDSTDFNFGTTWNTSTNRYTAPSTGYYYFSVSISLYNPNGRNFMVRVMPNGSSTGTDGKLARMEFGNYQDLRTMNLNAIMYLSANDYVDFQGYIEKDSSDDRRVLTGQNITYVTGWRVY